MVAVWLLLILGAPQCQLDVGLTPDPIFPSICTGLMLAHTWVLFWSKPAHSIWVRIWVQGVHSKGTDGPCQLWLFPLRAALQNHPAKLVLLNTPICPCAIQVTALFFELCYKWFLCLIFRSIKIHHLFSAHFLLRKLFKRVQCWLNSVCSWDNQQ